MSDELQLTQRISQAFEPANATAKEAMLAPGGDRAHPSSRRPRTYIRPRHGWHVPRLRELWHSRDLVALIAQRDITVRYRQTFFGVLWAVMVPLVQMAIFTIVFGQALSVGARVNAAAGESLPYPLFALSGLIVWNCFKATLDGASTSLLSHAHILRKVYLPRLVLPVAAIGRPALDATIAFAVLVALAAWYTSDGETGFAFSSGIVAMPLLLIGGAIAGLAVGLNLAALSVNYRDLQHVLPVMTSLLFFVTPVIYSVDLLPPALAWLIHLNPVVGFVEAHRALLFGLPVNGTGLVVSTVVSLLLLVIGALYFTRIEHQFADVA